MVDRIKGIAKERGWIFDSLMNYSSSTELKFNRHVNKDDCSIQLSIWIKRSSLLSLYVKQSGNGLNGGKKALSHFLDVVFSKTFFVGICREKKFSKIQHLRCETGPLSIMLLKDKLIAINNVIERRIKRLKDSQPLTPAQKQLIERNRLAAIQRRKAFLAKKGNDKDTA